ncbi:MAG: hypothetical protein KDK78_07645 [Chlamydiia bacterium]|nr:hypothetical protein [Chlamydiia bacterium]
MFIPDALENPAHDNCLHKLLCNKLERSTVKEALDCLKAASAPWEQWRDLGRFFSNAVILKVSRTEEKKWALVDRVNSCVAAFFSSDQGKPYEQWSLEHRALLRGFELGLDLWQPSKDLFFEWIHRYHTLAWRLCGIASLDALMIQSNGGTWPAYDEKEGSRLAGMAFQDLGRRSARVFIDPFDPQRTSGVPALRKIWLDVAAFSDPHIFEKSHMAAALASGDARRCFWSGAINELKSRFHEEVATIREASSFDQICDELQSLPAEECQNRDWMQMSSATGALTEADSAFLITYLDIMGQVFLCAKSDTLPLVAAKPNERDKLDHVVDRAKFQTDPEKIGALFCRAYYRLKSLTRYSKPMDPGPWRIAQGLERIKGDRQGASIKSEFWKGVQGQLRQMLQTDLPMYPNLQKCFKECIEQGKKVEAIPNAFRGHTSLVHPACFTAICYALEHPTRSRVIYAQLRGILKSIFANGKTHQWEEFHKVVDGRLKRGKSPYSQPKLGR